MASVVIGKDGRAVVQFIGPDKKRRTIRLGEMSKRNVGRFVEHLEQLIVAAKTGTLPPEDTSVWAARRLGSDLAGKLADYGLLTRRKAATLKEFLDSYVLQRADVKPGTKLVYNQAVDKLVAFFGAGKQLHEITEGDADSWGRYLQSKAGGELSEQTVRRRLGLAKQFFKSAVRNKLISQNPFADQKSHVQGNDKRQFFVDRDTITKVMAAMPDDEWKLLLALSRYGGLRCPSEHLALTWHDVDWENERMTVRSPKNERHQDGGVRVIPLFPEVREYLELAFENAKEGAVHVITRHRHNNVNLRTQFMRFLQRAGVEPWPRIFQNLRASRATELAADFPLHVVTKWMGHTPEVAREHYLTVRDTDFERAAKSKPDTSPRAASALHTGHDQGKPRPTHRPTPVQIIALGIDQSPTVGTTGFSKVGPV